MTLALHQMQTMVCFPGIKITLFSTTSKDSLISPQNLHKSGASEYRILTRLLLCPTIKWAERKAYKNYVHHVKTETSQHHFKSNFFILNGGKEIPWLRLKKSNTLAGSVQTLLDDTSTANCAIVITIIVFASITAVLFCCMPKCSVSSTTLNEWWWW